jgi:2-amino-4-hydroxy-6-hydroxymethyldihydropteridine diphosphokinase
MPPSTTEPATIEPAIVYVGLGANLGDTHAAMRSALAALARLPLTEFVAASPLYRSAPVDAGGPDYTNAVAAITTRLAPLDLLARLQEIEHEHGRERPFRNAPRRLDLDILLYADRCITLPQLQVPHPRMHQRAFVLRPLADLAPDLEVPGHGRVAQLLARVGGQRVKAVVR